MLARIVQRRGHAIDRHQVHRGASPDLIGDAVQGAGELGFSEAGRHAGDAHEPATQQPADALRRLVGTPTRVFEETPQQLAPRPRGRTLGRPPRPAPSVMRLAIIHPPDGAIPTVPYSSIPHLNGVLKQHGHVVLACDAGLELIHHVLVQERL